MGQDVGSGLKRNENHKALQPTCSLTDAHGFAQSGPDVVLYCHVSAKASHLGPPFATTT